MSEELAWCAGFFDGEGCIKYYNIDGARLIQLSIQQKFSPLLYRFQAATGIGKIYKMHGTREIYALRTSKIVEIEKVYELLSPWLGELKKSDFEIAIRSHKEHTDKGKSTWRRRRAWKDKHCPNCDSRWNQVICDSCGHTG